jgi:multidrug efflux pump subunit AcrB
VDRQRAAQIGLTQRDVANNLLISLSSSGLLSPSYFLNPANGVNYSVIVRAPSYHLNSVSGLLATPLTAASPGLTERPTPASGVGLHPKPATATLGSVASLLPRTSPSNVAHYTVQRVVDVAANVEGRDLQAVARDVEASLRSLGNIPSGMRISLRGQHEVMRQSFRSLGLGLLLAIALVYCLLVVFFQSWVDPLIVMIAVPGALVGILWMLALTGTTINIESLMGGIMAVGIAVSNSVLLVTFANDLRLEQNISAMEAALQAGKSRLRPVLITSLAMIIGVLPMALAWGEAGEQNAPLGLAVIGGLIMATLVTLLIVPLAYATFRGATPTKQLIEARFLAEKSQVASKRVAS